MRLFPTPVPPDYRCPICPEDVHETFFMSSLVGMPICDVCELELSHFADDDERREDDVVDAAERISGKSWDECRIAIFQDNLDYWLRIKVEQPEEHFRRTMEALDWSRKQCEEDIERKIGVLKEKIERLS